MVKLIENNVTLIIINHVNNCLKKKICGFYHRSITQNNIVQVGSACPCRCIIIGSYTHTWQLTLGRPPL